MPENVYGQYARYAAKLDPPEHAEDTVPGRGISRSAGASRP
jgi:hypothetical protein